ncbi:multiprotein-bridging factor 1 family protein [Streptomyces pilosus]|uniref:helix-turn-helix domain-containing protein n=1 Tax=Streptomyces pilosus TaxID=28893 RepID=UPI0036F57CCA
MLMLKAGAMSEESERLAKALIAFRKAEGISVRELARRTQLSQATIRRHESDRGGLPVPFAARRFEEVLGRVPGSIPAAAGGPTDVGLRPDSDGVTG